MSHVTLNSEINSVCLTLVASRNLTTLFASCCMLHPQVQVLNHFPSMNKNNSTNFLVDYSDEKFNNFINEVLRISENAIKIPGQGGIITESHAFRKKIMHDRYHKRYDSSYKENVKSIIWKDSVKNTHILEKKNIKNLLLNNDKLRFIGVVRNPMDCAVSNSKKGYRKEYKGNTKEEILEELFLRYVWFFNLEKNYNNKFMHFFQNEVNYKLLDKLQDFLLLKNDKKWKEDVLKTWQLKKSYDHSDEFLNLYKKLINKYIVDSSLKEKFYYFLDH